MSKRVMDFSEVIRTRIKIRENSIYEEIEKTLRIPGLASLRSKALQQQSQQQQDGSITIITMKSIQSSMRSFLENDKTAVHLIPRRHRQALLDNQDGVWDRMLQLEWELEVQDSIFIKENVEALRDGDIIVGGYFTVDQIRRLMTSASSSIQFPEIEVVESYKEIQDRVECFYRSSSTVVEGFPGVQVKECRQAKWTQFEKRIIDNFDALASIVNVVRSCRLLYPSSIQHYANGPFIFICAFQLMKKCIEERIDCILLYSKNGCMLEKMLKRLQEWSDHPTFRHCSIKRFEATPDCFVQNTTFFQDNTRTIVDNKKKVLFVSLSGNNNTSIKNYFRTFLKIKTFFFFSTDITENAFYHNDNDYSYLIEFINRDPSQQTEQDDETLKLSHSDFDQFIKQMDKDIINIPLSSKISTSMIELLLQEMGKLTPSEIKSKKNFITTTVDHIPNIIHFVYGLKEQTSEFELFKYLAIISAYHVNQPTTIYFHYHYEPYGFWWEKIKPLLTMMFVELPEEIYGNKIDHYAHKADIIRLTQLIKYGGIYLDVDTICLKPFTDLLHHDFVMGLQNQNYGLCNAIMLSKPYSIFGQLWMDEYKTFDSTQWDYHSVVLPLRLAKLYPYHIKILNPRSLFYPLWDQIDRIMFQEPIIMEEYKNIIRDSYAMHLWETIQYKRLESLDETNILTQNTIYNLIMRKYIRNQISIVMLTHNRDIITQNCLESYIDALNRDDIKEFIILDNNSEPSFKEILKHFSTKSPKIRIIFSPENLGVGPGRKILFEEAKGDIICSLDSDAKLLNASFFDKVKSILYNEKIGMVGVSGCFIDSWVFGKHRDTSNDDPHEYYVTNLAGCCQCFRKDLLHVGFQIDDAYGKFWVEDTDLSLQILYLNKKNYRIPQLEYLYHDWGGSGKAFQSLFKKNWIYFSKKWSKKINLSSLSYS
uniref:Glycosyltransferase 2-like domain-containing protein n=1 Tax=viral metagenome TaxID=1070528 RepID=A0A6C0K5B6_9ZZZZ